ncbi:MAG: hypothetical protein JW384_02622 [Nitrosomonadaceae bacterium]|nr:hypothetical protein [Nitrosomonadaceae bacterium]
MGKRRKSVPAVLPRDDHAEKTILLNELPDFRWQIMKFASDLPLVQHLAQLLHRTGEEVPLLGRQLRLGVG